MYYRHKIKSNPTNQFFFTFLSLSKNFKVFSWIQTMKHFCGLCKTRKKFMKNTFREYHRYKVIITRWKFRSFLNMILT